LNDTEAERGEDEEAEKEKEISYYDGWKEGRTDGQMNAYSECQ